MDDRCYYVYVYIDPRNYEEFYYGKGKGSRRLAHLSDDGDSEKTRRIQQIKDEGETPIIRTIAAGLTEAEAHLIETTLIWKLGRSLTNKAAGRYTSLFRPHNTLHRRLPSFDFQNRVYYFNVGEDEIRNWDDCRRLGFLSAGQGAEWRDQIRDIEIGDLLVAYLKRYGYVGVGRVLQPSRRYMDFRINGKLLHDYKLAANMQANSDSDEKSEYVVQVEWLCAVDRTDAKWKKLSGLFTTPLIKASLENQPDTRRFIEESFSISFEELTF